MKCCRFVWILLMGHLCWAQTPYRTLSLKTSGPQPLNAFLYHLVDPTGQIDITKAIQLQKDGKFTASFTPTSRQDFGYNTDFHWLYFALTSPEKSDLMLEIEYANLDYVELFEVKNGKITPLGLSGDRFQFRQRPYTNNNYVFPIRLQAGEKAQYFLMLDQPHAILSFFIKLWHRSDFLRIDREEYMLWGIYVGIICIVMIMNLVMLLATKDWIYLWYSLYLHFMTMHLFSDAGLGFQYLWSDFPKINAYAPVYLYVWAAMIAQTTFMQYFIQQTRRNSRVFWWINTFKIMVAMALVAAIGIPLFEVKGREEYMYKIVSQTTSYLVPIIVVLTVISLYERRHEREQLVRYYGYALIVQFLGYSTVAFINFCQTQGWALPFDVETYVIIGLTVLLDIVFFTYGLAHRYSNFRRNNQRLELALLKTRQETQQRMIDSLEEERRRLAQDLHDDIGATLSTAKAYLSVLRRKEPTQALLQSQRLLDQAADELRTISHQLMPKHFDKIGLAKAVEETIRKVSGSQTQFEFVSMGEVKKLDTQTEMLIFSIATEWVRTIQKQGLATEATVQLIYHKELLNLSVEDNGQPIDANGKTAADLSNLRAKAAFLKADLLIDSNRYGSSIMLSVPIPQTQTV